MRSLPYFPIVPRNAPPDDLRSYLDLYSREAVGMQMTDAPSHAEWDVNLPIPRMRQRWGTERSQLAAPVITPLMLNGVGLRELREFSGGARFAGVGEPLGTDPSLSFPSTGVAKVSALWAQRGVNAWFAAHGRSTRIATDNVVGTETLNALRAVRLAWLATLPTPLPTSPRVVSMPAASGRNAVTMAGDLASALSRLMQVADPAASSAPPEELPPDPSVHQRASSSVVVAVALGIGAAMWFGRRR
jgi:hypothetical protein